MPNSVYIDLNELDESADSAVNLILEKIASPIANHPWLKEFSDRNAISIDGTIAQDVFGNLSDFNENYPQATIGDKLNILKSFIEGTTFEDFDIPDITSGLKGFIETSIAREKDLDSIVVNLKYQGQISPLFSLPANLYLDLLDQVQILNHMEKMIEDENAHENFQELKDWLTAKRNQISNNYHNGMPSHEQNSWRHYFLHTNRVAKFIKTEIKNKISLLQVLRDGLFNSVERLNPSDFSSFFKSIPYLSLKIAYEIGQIGLFPRYLLLEAIKEVLYNGASKIGDFYDNYLKLSRESVDQISADYVNVRFAVERVLAIARFLAEFYNLRLVTTMEEVFEFILTKLPKFILQAAFVAGAAYGISSYFQIQFPLLMLLGIQFMPENWYLGDFFNIYFGSALLIATSSTVMGVGKLAINLTHKAYDFISSWWHNTPQTLSPLNDEQRTKLLILLMKEHPKIESSLNLTQEQKKKKKAKLGAETSKLHNKNNPYILSSFDLKLLARQTEVPEAFNLFKDKIDEKRMPMAPN